MIELATSGLLVSHNTQLGIDSTRLFVLAFIGYEYDLTTFISFINNHEFTFECPEVNVCNSCIGNYVAGGAALVAAYQEFQKLSDTELPLGRAKKNIIFPSPGLLLRDDTTGNTSKAVKALAAIDYEVTEELVPFNLVTSGEICRRYLVTILAENCKCDGLWTKFFIRKKGPMRMKHLSAAYRNPRG